MQHMAEFYQDPLYISNKEKLKKSNRPHFREDIFVNFELKSKK